jgi:TRAP-type C4-dicarboxylate transport system substrate-binding protein
MNKETYASLPEADRAVLDSMSGAKTAEWIADVVDTTDASIEADYRAGGKVNFIELTEAEQAKWDRALSGAADKWVEAQTDPDNARKVVETARKISAE